MGECGEGATGRAAAATEAPFCEVHSEGMALVCVPLAPSLPRSTRYCFLTTIFKTSLTLLSVRNHNSTLFPLDLWNLESSRAGWVLAQEGPLLAHSAVPSYQESMSALSEFNGFTFRSKHIFSTKDNPFIFNLEAAFNAFCCAVVWVQQLNRRCGLVPALCASQGSHQGSKHRPFMCGPLD